MALDKTSEIIAHFIGIFEATEEGARLREIAEGFRHKPAEDPAFDPLNSVNLLLRLPYTHEGSWDGLSDFQFYADAPPVVPDVAQGRSIAGQPDYMVTFDPANLPRFAGGFPESGNSLLFIGIPPGSTAIVGHQFNVLVDHDLMIGTGATAFIAPEFFDNALQSLATVSGELTQDLIGNPFTVIADAAGFGAALGTQYASIAQSAPQGAEVSYSSGPASLGTTVTGQAADTAPALQDVMPAHLQSEDAADEEAPATAPAGVGGNAAAAAEVFDVDDGHHVVAGGNFAINETIVTFSTVDAPVIAVMGDAISLLSISQVNVIHNHDTGIAPAQAPDVALNAATMAIETSQSPDAVAAPEQSQEMPQGWAVTRLEADLMTVNWVHQYNFISDHDRAEVTFSGEDSFLSFGENTALNQTTLLEIGWGYDLIIVGGQMIDMALISQTNVLFDDDMITYAGDWPAVLTGGDNLAFNAASIQSVGIDTHIGMDADFAQAGDDLAAGGATISGDVAQSDYFAGIPFLNVLYIAGDMITATVIEQINILGDADQIAVQLAGLDSQHGAPDGPVAVTAGSNAAVNIAAIMEYGMDSTVMVGGEVYDDVLLFQAELIDTDADPLGVAQTPPLANEAVAFLADDMVDDAPVTDCVFAEHIETTSTSVDVMGAVVT